jgi:hypothetical protein
MNPHHVPHTVLLAEKRRPTCRHGVFAFGRGAEVLFVLQVSLVDVAVALASGWVAGWAGGTWEREAVVSDVVVVFGGCGEGFVA